MRSLPPEDTSLPADRLAQRYRLLDVLGTGGSASVYRAWDEREQAFRAIKVIDGKLAQNPRVRARLLQEAEVMGRLQHHHIVKVFDAGADDTRLFLVMELLLGGSLMERIAEEGPLPPRMAVTVLAGVLQALQCAHDNGVVHRDVKPHNVLLDGKGTPKVTDFGIARFDEAVMTRTGTVLGTLAFMPPEQKLSSRKVDPRSDLYAAGATLYTALTGRFPHDLYAAELDETHARDLYRGISPEIAAVIRQATAFRIEGRFASASAMQAALVAAVASLPDDPEGPPLVSPLRLGRARSLGSVGPTLLGVTESAEPTEPSRVVIEAAPIARETPRPPPLSPQPQRSPLPWLLAAAVLALITVIAVAQLRTPRAARAPAPNLDEASLAEEIQAEPDAQPAEPEISPKARRKPSTGPEELEPDTPILPVSSGLKEKKIGRWSVRRSATGRQKSEITAHLAADRALVAPNGDRVIPYLTLSCTKAAVTAVLHTGALAAQAEAARAEIIGQIGAFALSETSVPGDLLFPRGSGQKILASPEVRVDLGALGVAVFTVGDGDAVIAEFDGCRR